MKKVLITGGTGFVGHWMRYTQPAGLECRYIGHAEYDIWKCTHWTEPDRYDYIVHLAPVAPTEVIECARIHKARLLYCSSGIVYYQTDNITYKVQKVFSEYECLDNHRDVVIARLFTFMGDFLDDQKAVTQFIAAAKNGQPIHIHGDGKTVRSYMHGSEMGRWLWAILLKGKSGQAYDVGSDEPTTILQLAEQVREKYNSSAPIVIEYGNDPVPLYLPKDTAKTKALL